MINIKVGLKKVKELLFAFLFIFILVLVFFPNIYIKQQIYFKSRNISKLSTDVELLQNQNQKLKLEVEKMKFKNSISDTLF